MTTKRTEAASKARHLTRKQAFAAYRRVCRNMNVESHDLSVRQGYPGWISGMPMLCEHFEDRYRWAIVWEGGSEDWTVKQGERENNRPRTPVLAEPLNSYSLALFLDAR